MTRSSAPLPSRWECALGAFLEDIGKFMQRAHGSVARMDPAVRARESIVLPTNGHGGYSHKHALWTEAFFQWMEDEGLSFPRGVNRDRVRDVAVFHHRPEEQNALAHLAAEADRLSSGMDRKPRDEMLETEAERRGWDKFIRTALLSPFCQVDLGFGSPRPHRHRLAELVPDERLLPAERVTTDDFGTRYAELWKRFCAEFAALCRERAVSPGLFAAGLLSLSERYTWAIPSSTVDLPDISLHDHNRTVAAIAVCLHAWHEADGSLDDPRAVRDRDRPKFRLLVGDLSGIQPTLFRLANEQVRGVSRILRARSFLLGALTEATALAALERLELTPFNSLLDAGGRFMLLVPDLPHVSATVEALRGEIDAWMVERYLGELTLNLALGPPFAGNDLLPPRFRELLEATGRDVEQCKQRPLATRADPVLRLAYPEGECAACGVRPAAREADGVWRCAVCDDEHRVGGLLPHTRALSWSTTRSEAPAVELPAGLLLSLHTQGPPRPRPETLALCRLWRGAEDTARGPWPLRHLAAHLPTLGPGEATRREYADLGEEAATAGEGDTKTFEHIAADALELDREGRPLGEPFLAVLKADVDRLGMVFGHGLRRERSNAEDRATISRFAALSRMLDLFFTAHLPELLRERFPSTYTVYAGGDDLLLIGPWRQTLELAATLRGRFGQYVGANPNLTLSAGIELVKAHQPLNRAAAAAEKRLERAKSEGRNRVCVIDREPLPWDRFGELLAKSDELSRLVRDRDLPIALLYRLLYFIGERRRAEHEGDIRAADWRARWGYHLARNVLRRRGGTAERSGEQEAKLFNDLLGVNADIQVICDPAPRLPVVAALYRNRH